MTRTRALATRTFRSLRTRNYRLYFVGQMVSLTGTWMQSVGQAWLVLQLTGSGLALGGVTALQFVPLLVGGPWGGAIADRFDKRRILLATQTAAGALALTLGILVVTNAVSLWMVYALAFSLGIVNLVDMPTRQSFVMEMVGRDEVTNAVSLNSVLVNVSRVTGPALAGLLIWAVGMGPCFLLNSISYGAMVVALSRMRPDELIREVPARPERARIRDGLAYVRRSQELRGPLLVMLVVGTLGFNFSVLLPLVTHATFGLGAGSYGLAFSVMGVGAVIGGLVVAAKGVTGRALIGWSATAFGVAVWAMAVSPTFGWLLAAMAPVGAANTVLIASTNSLLQLGSEPGMRGRVMALYAMVFLGTTPIGSPLAGWTAERFGPRVALAGGATASLLAGLALVVAIRARSRARSAEEEAHRPASLASAAS